MDAQAEKFCEYCEDEGVSSLPHYGVAPHECFWKKGPQFTIGQSTLLPIEQWDVAFVPDMEPGETWADFAYPSACGVFYCPNCHADSYKRAWDSLVARIGEPPAQGMSAGTAETGTGSGLQPASPVPQECAQGGPDASGN